MMIVSAKISKRKLLLGLLAAVAVITLLVVLLNASEEPTVSSEPVVQTLDGATNEDRVAFLQSFGWQVAETPTETQEVRIPEEFNEVFTRYNQLQQSQGFDLNRQAGKSCQALCVCHHKLPGRKFRFLRHGSGPQKQDHRRRCDLQIRGRENARLRHAYTQSGISSMPFSVA